MRRGAVGGGQWGAGSPRSSASAPPRPRPWLALHPQAWSAHLEGQTQLPSAWGLGGGRRKPQAYPTTHAPPEGWVPCRPALPSKGKASASSWPSTGAWGWGGRRLTRPGARLSLRGPLSLRGQGSHSGQRTTSSRAAVCHLARLPLRTLSCPAHPSQRSQTSLRFPRQPEHRVFLTRIRSKRIQGINGRKMILWSSVHSGSWRQSEQSHFRQIKWGVYF